jgi:hypothetical protein
LAVGEEIIDDQADDREEENEERPEDLVRRRAGGFEHLDEDQNVEDKDDDTDDTAAGTVAPGCILDVDQLVTHGGAHGE